MIITQPPDAKLPEHLYQSYSTLPRLPASNDPASDHVYPPHRQSLSSTDSELPPAYAEPAPHLPPPPRRPRSKRRLRFIAAGVLMIYIASTTVLLALFLTGHLRRNHPFRDRDWPSAGALTPALPPGYRPPGAPVNDGFADLCNTWMSTPGPRLSKRRTDFQPEYSDYLQFALTGNSSAYDTVKLFVHSGINSAASGTFTVTSDESLEVPIVDVTMKYRTWGARNATNVCLMRTLDMVGLGIYTSNSSAPEHPSFDIALHLPSGLFVDELNTLLPYFTQNVGRRKVKFTVPFGLLKLQGTFSPMYVNGDDVTAQNVEAQTSFSTIYGEFTTSESLTLKTSQASVSDFTIQATSANAPVSVVVTHDKDSSAAKIDVSASSSYAPVVVSLDPMFEGTFSLSSGVGADLKEDLDLPDPIDPHSGRSRHYVITQSTAFEVHGSVDWGPDWAYPGPPRMGSANLTTQHAKAVLYLKKQCTGDICPNMNAMSLPVSG
ncbi:hypothetical protein FRB99_005718 [Tulasnella sp. 403]|nr:hypothetical protein FRB99_005718 [Tulasnella sp. 403]